MRKRVVQARQKNKSGDILVGICIVLFALVVAVANISGDAVILGNIKNTFKIASHDLDLVLVTPYTSVNF